MELVVEVEPKLNIGVELNHRIELDLESDSGTNLEIELPPKRLWMLEDEQIARVRLYHFMVQLFEMNKERSGLLLWRLFSNTRRVMNVNYNGSIKPYKAYLTPTMNKMYDIYISAQAGKLSFREALVYITNLGALAQGRHQDSPLVSRQEIYREAAELNVIENKPILEGELFFKKQCKKIAASITTLDWDVHRWAGEKQPGQQDNKRRITDTMVIMLQEINACESVPAVKQQTWERAYFNIIYHAKTAAIRHEGSVKSQSLFYRSLSHSFANTPIDNSAKVEIDNFVTKLNAIPEEIAAGAPHVHQMKVLSKKAHQGMVSNTEALDKIMRLGHQALASCCFFSKKHPETLNKFYEDVADGILNP